MIYRITLQLAFSDQDAIEDIKDKALDHLSEAVIINEGYSYEERGYVMVERCYHDEFPRKECEQISLSTP